MKNFNETYEANTTQGPYLDPDSNKLLKKSDYYEIIRNLNIEWIFDYIKRLFFVYHYYYYLAAIVVSWLSFLKSLPLRDKYCNR